MDGSPATVARLIVAGLFALLPVYFLVRALRSGPRSRRFANVALFCGLTAFVMPEITIGLGDGTRAATFVWSGGVRLVVGLIGLVLVVAALVARRDGGTGVVRPVIGLLFCLLHLAFAVGLMVTGNTLRYQTPGTPDVTGTPTDSGSGWTYQPPRAAYRLTLPSADWKEAPPIGGQGEVSFFRSAPQMHSSVLTLMRDQTEADFTRAATAFREHVESSPTLLSRPSSRDGVNSAGNRYRYGTTMESGPQGRRLFLAYSVTWCEKKRLIVRAIFEGVCVMNSEAGRTAELEAMNAAAERILLSVE